jgi:hypothetical protein
VSYAVPFPFGHAPRLYAAIFFAVPGLSVRPHFSVEQNVKVR